LPPAVLSRRDRVIISSCLVLLTALAWMYLLHLAHQMSAAMGDDRMMVAMGMPMDAGWTATDVLVTFAMWAVMMVGMMTASAAPAIFLFAGMHRGRGAPHAARVVLAFGAGYLLVWTAFSAGAAAAQWGLHQAALLTPAMATSSVRLGGAILMAAGAYQLTPFKGGCLSHCRSPLGFLLSHWRDGPVGALRMGMAHGSHCLGCCWALMGVLFVMGVMNLVWVAAVTIFVLVEKVGPAGTIIARIAGVAMIVAGAVVWSGHA
jgi:predicted metal-binding membrane protein